MSVGAVPTFCTMNGVCHPSGPPSIFVMFGRYTVVVGSDAARDECAADDHGVAATTRTMPIAKRRTNAPPRRGVWRPKQATRRRPPAASPPGAARARPPARTPAPGGARSLVLLDHVAPPPPCVGAPA